MMALLLYSIALYLAGVCTVLHVTSKCGLVAEVKQMLSHFVRNTLGL